MEGMEDEEKEWKMEDMETGKINKVRPSAELPNSASVTGVRVRRLTSCSSLRSVLKSYHTRSFPMHILYGS